MALAGAQDSIMKLHNNLYGRVCSPENIELAWRKARKRKTLKQYVIDFEKNLKDNLALLRVELLLHSYRPLPLKNFVINDPKTRKISVSDFRDRIVHHAVCNIIEPIFDRKFIHDSYANRKGKGTLAAIKRLEKFQRKVSRNGTAVRKFGSRNIRGFFFKGDIKHYFATVSHEKLIEILKRTIRDDQLLFLIKNILKNHNPKEKDMGMPLGNMTSQFFANVYLNELDQYVKHELKAKYYIRYVDDFVILHNDRDKLHFYKERINEFLREHLLIELSAEKSRIRPLNRGIEFLGFRTFYHYKLLRRRNIRKAYRKLEQLKSGYDAGNIDYDIVYDFMEGWIACSSHANTHSLRKKVLGFINGKFEGEISTKECNRYLKICNV